MIHPGGDGFLQNANGGVGIFWRPEHAGAGELHGAVSKPVNLTVA